MNVLIVYAHPEPKSFNGAMKDAAVEVFTSAGFRVTVSDLYAQRFPAAGGPEDFADVSEPGFFQYQKEQRRGRFESKLEEEMRKLRDADLVIFQFPLWWFSLPAILKGWVDRVFAMGFAYDVGKSYDAGPLRGKLAMLAFTTGGPEAAYGAAGRNGDLEGLIRHIEHGMLYFTGMRVLPRFVVYGASRLPEAEREARLQAYRARLLEIAESHATIKSENVSPEPV
ncbi:MAG: NAD(P)H-dependent oxidoreductase [Bryobacteraceae bacterium]|nr:NAD(P)H-dependent oxidoreductase [Bryobacteraceae bacterium]